MFIFWATRSNTFRTQQKYRDPGSISSSYCGPFCLSDYPKDKIKCCSKWQPSYRSVLQFSLAPLVFLYFGLHFRTVTYLCRNRFPDTMLHMAAVAKTAATSKFDLSCRPLLSEHASRILCFIWRPSQKQPRPVSSTSPVGLFLLSEHRGKNSRDQ